MAFTVLIIKEINGEKKQRKEVHSDFEPLILFPSGGERVANSLKLGV